MPQVAPPSRELFRCQLGHRDHREPGRVIDGAPGSLVGKVKSAVQSFLPEG